MLNMFVAKKWGALLLIGFLSVIMYIVGNVYYGLWGGIGFFLPGLLLGVLIANILLHNPFTSMLEGKGILVFNLDSTGVLRPFIIKLASPYIKGKLMGKDVEDVFDRGAIVNLATPVVLKNSVAEPKEDGGLLIDISEKEYNSGRFALWHYPVLLYNDQVGSIITKDFLGDVEKGLFSKHTILYLNKKVEELSSDVKHFARYVVENLRPKNSLGMSTWVWIIVVGLLIILLLLFAPAIIDTAKSFSSPMGDAFNTAKAGAITPRG